MTWTHFEDISVNFVNVTEMCIRPHCPFSHLR